MTCESLIHLPRQMAWRLPLQGCNNTNLFLTVHTLSTQQHTDSCLSELPSIMRASSNLVLLGIILTTPAYAVSDVPLKYTTCGPDHLNIQSVTASEFPSE